MFTLHSGVDTKTSEDVFMKDEEKEIESPHKGKNKKKGKK